MCMLFAGEGYYAKGGFNDFQGCFFDIESARRVVEANQASAGYDAWDWWHIIDNETLEVLDRSSYQAYGCDYNCYVGEGE
ncbi:MAG: hypothetical protein ACXW1D_00045 [Halobacteriota archaeon]